MAVIEGDEYDDGGSMGASVMDDVDDGSPICGGLKGRRYEPMVLDDGSEREANEGRSFGESPDWGKFGC